MLNVSVAGNGTLDLRHAFAEVNVQPDDTKEHLVYIVHYEKEETFVDHGPVLTTVRKK